MNIRIRLIIVLLGMTTELGIDYALKDTQSPSAERVANANTILETEKYTRWKK